MSERLISIEEFAEEPYPHIDSFVSNYELEHPDEFESDLKTASDWEELVSFYQEQLERHAYLLTISHGWAWLNRFQAECWSRGVGLLRSCPQQT